MDLQGMDDSSMRLVIQLQLEDLESITSSSKGKHRMGETPDHEAAVKSYKSELESLKEFLADQSMSRSISDAVRVDAEILEHEQFLETQAQRDREMALELDTGSKRKATSEDDGQRGKAPKRLKPTFSQELIDLTDEPESSSWAASRKPTAPTELVACASCTEQHQPCDVFSCPCSHKYCRYCLVGLFRASFRDESLFPPRCCRQVIPIEQNQSFFATKLVGEYRAKEVEFKTPNRTYCHVPDCSTFIPLQFIKGDIGHCVRCNKTTCIICKGQSHESDCPEDHDVQDVVRMAGENGWQRCRTCRRIVELDHGCNHMTCHCGAQFCYVCGAPWKTCKCPQWTEERLLAGANLNADRQADAELNPERRNQLVEAERENLEQNHECRHRRWRTRDGAHNCDNCHDRLRTFIYECTRCRVMACRRCRFHRL